MRRLFIVGATFSGNRGAEAMLTTVIQQTRLRFPDCEICVFSYAPNEDMQTLSDASVNLYSGSPAAIVFELVPGSLAYKILRRLPLKNFDRFVPSAVVSLAKADALVCISGVSFIDGREKYLPFNVLSLLPAFLLGVPVVKLAQALGPFRNPVNRAAAKWTISRCQHVFARGPESFNYLKELLPKASNVERAEDLAFLFDPDASYSVAGQGFDDVILKINEARDHQSAVVGVCASAVVSATSSREGLDYECLLAETIRRLTDDKRTVVLYPHATKATRKDGDRNNDLPLIERVAAKVRIADPDRLIVANGEWNASQISRIVDACDIHLVSRFHAMIASLSHSRPVMVLGWSHKYTEVLKSFGQEDMSIDYKDASAETLTERVNLLIQQRTERAEAIYDALPECRRNAALQLDSLRQSRGS